MPFTTTATIRSFGGYLYKLTHSSASTGTPMSFNLYLPPNVTASTSAGTVPVLIYLSGLTCTGDNCSEKGFLQHAAAKRGLAVVYPDTSPRGAGVEGEDTSWDLGTGAGFYVDATTEPWRGKYNMYSYVTEELPRELFAEFKMLDERRIGILGHSMGGHGALTLYLRNPGKYKSVSAFAPICNPTNAPWGIKAFTAYYGPDKSTWRISDATELVKLRKEPLNVLIDVGTSDKFYQDGQLLPENFAKAAEDAGVRGPGFQLRFQEGYDHSYYFVATFAEEHVNYHADILCR